MGHAVPALEPGVKDQNDNMPKISKMQIDLLVQSFAADFARVATLQITNSVGRREDALDRRQRGTPRALTRARQQRRGSGEAYENQPWYAEQVAYLAQRLAETPEPGGPGSLLDNTVIMWTNELGQGNSHTLDNIPFVLVGGGLDFKMGRSLKLPNVHHNRLLLSLAHGFGHRIERFGNPDFCGGGPLSELT